MSEVQRAPGWLGAVVTFALPDESRALVASLDGAKSVVCLGQPMLPGKTGYVHGRMIEVVHTGMGDTSAGRLRLMGALGSEELATAENGKFRRWRFVIAAGYAGALDPALAVGDLVLGENFSDPALAASARALLAGERLHVGQITSQGKVAETAAAKAALAAETGAVAVDMETGWIAEICREMGIPLLSLRVISDAAGQDFPVPGQILFNAVRQRPRYLALPAWLVAHPGSIAPFAAFVRRLGPARERLTQALRLLVERL